MARETTTGERTTEDERPELGARILSVLYQSRRRPATIAAIAIACFLAYYVTFGSNGVNIYQQKRNEDRALQKQLQELQEENTRLQEHLQHLQTDPDAIEHEARVILRYAKPGEVIYTLNDKPGSKAPAK